MKSGIKLMAAILALGSALPFAALPFSAVAEDRPIYQQEVERIYPEPQMQQPPQQPGNNFYNPNAEMAPPPMNPQPRAVQNYQPPSPPDGNASNDFNSNANTIEEQRRRPPSLNTDTPPLNAPPLTAAPAPARTEHQQAGFVAPVKGSNDDAPEDKGQTTEKIKASDGDDKADKNAPVGDTKEEAILPPPVDTTAPQWVETGFGNFKILNKVYTRNQEAKIKKNEVAKFGSITVKLEKCFRMPESDKRESSALLLISETYKSQPTKEIFHGWMFSSSPAISALEHPLYDVILLGCEDEEKKAPATEIKDAKDTKKDATKPDEKTKDKPKAKN